MPRNFAWSWSRLKNWRACPKRHYEIEIAKRVKEPETEELAWGHLYHKAMQERIERGKELPKGWSSGHDYWPGQLRRVFEDGADVRVELKLAMDRDFQPTEWFAPTTWFRGVVDVLGLAPHISKALAVDWKTGGSIKPEMEQLALNAQLIFAHHPEIEEVNTLYFWSAHLAEPLDIKNYKRADMVPLWNKLLPEVRQMEEAALTTTYPPRPSGLCISWCPVTSCPHHGKGTRT
jgi:hypothetical protein